MGDRWGRGVMWSGQVSASWACRRWPWVQEQTWGLADTMRWRDRTEHPSRSTRIFGLKFSALPEKTEIIPRVDIESGVPLLSWLENPMRHKVKKLSFYHKSGAKLTLHSVPYFHLAKVMNKTLKGQTIFHCLSYNLGTKLKSIQSLTHIRSIECYWVHDIQYLINNKKHIKNKKKKYP